MMTGAGRLRIVGGNPTLKRLPKSVLRPFQPTLRVVQPGDFEKQPLRRTRGVGEASGGTATKAFLIIFMSSSLIPNWGLHVVGSHEKRGAQVF